MRTGHSFKSVYGASVRCCVPFVFDSLHFGRGWSEQQQQNGDTSFFILFKRKKKNRLLALIISCGILIPFSLSPRSSRRWQIMRLLARERTWRGKKEEKAAHTLSLAYLYEWFFNGDLFGLKDEGGAARDSWIEDDLLAIMPALNHQPNDDWYKLLSPQSFKSH